jgi:simple sugar transport system ATP-binding protein
LRHFSLQARAGEVIGLAGLEGSGQRLALQVCAGLRRPLSGQIRLRGEDVTGRPYRCFLDRGVAYAPAGRLEEALLPGMTLAEHVALAEPAPTLLVDWRAALERTHRRLHEYDILGTPVTRVEELSGGNQQRTVLALLPSQAPLLLMEHPVRGLDLGSCECVWRLLEGRTRQGAAVVFATSDLDELFDRSDRILVFFAGRVSPPLDSRHATPQLIGELMGGKGFE